jgi:hypothetical protein
MKYDGVVASMDDILYLFLLHPLTGKILDGVNITDDMSYKFLKTNQLVVVRVLFKDGTLEMDNFDIEEFVYGEGYGMFDVFLHIEDVSVLTLNIDDAEVSIMDTINDGNFEEICKKAIKSSRDL